MSAVLAQPTASAPSNAIAAPPLVACLLATPYGLAEVERAKLAHGLHAYCEELAVRVVWRELRGQPWPGAVTLELGCFAPSEAQRTCEPLLAWLAERDIPARIGVGPNDCLAQLAAQIATPGAVRVVEADDRETFLRSLPIQALEGLPATGFTPHDIYQLQRLDVLTVADLLRLATPDARALQDQCGAVALPD